MAEASAVDEQFALLVSLFVARPGVTGPDPSRRGFGSNSLRVNGKVFAMVPKIAGLTFKLPRDAVADYVAAGEGVHFDPNLGRPMKEWFVLSPDSTLDPVELAEAAYAYVRSVAT